MANDKDCLEQPRLWQVLCACEACKPCDANPQCFNVRGFVSSAPSSWECGLRKCEQSRESCCTCEPLDKRVRNHLSSDITNSIHTAASTDCHVLGGRRRMSIVPTVAIPECGQCHGNMRHAACPSDTPAKSRGARTLATVRHTTTLSFWATQRSNCV